MIIARFEFLPEHAEYFCEGVQYITEMQFDTITEMVDFTKLMEHCLHEVLVYDGANLISLREITKETS